ncbi:unnamed protein product, partial [Nesidiocoris tenuis]
MPMLITLRNKKNLLENRPGFSTRIGLMVYSASFYFRGARIENVPTIPNKDRFCLNTETVETETALQVWNILSVNNDQNGTEFVSSMEHNAYPFVGVQFHPEKSLYSTSSVFRIENDYSSNIANRWFYDWIVQESWKNNNSFPLGELDKLVMQNYCPQFTVRPNWSHTCLIPISTSIVDPLVNRRGESAWEIDNQNHGNIFEVPTVGQLQVKSRTFWAAFRSKLVIRSCSSRSVSILTGAEVLVRNCANVLSHARDGELGGLAAPPMVP